MAPSGWKIISTTKATEVERPATPYCAYLEGDVFGLIVPLRWPLSHDLEDNLTSLGERQIMLIWQIFVARSESDPPGAPDVVPFPETDEELAECLPMPDGSPLDLRYMTWRPAEGRTPIDRPRDWSQLLPWWYRAQLLFTKTDLVTAFGEALEAMVGLPLERAAPLLHIYLTSEDSGAAVSGFRVASTSNGKKTAAKSGRSPTSSSSRTRTKSNGQTSTNGSAPSD